MRYVYHLGAHKTGSTLIQKNLSLNLEALRAQGIWYVNEEMPKAISKQRKILRQFRTPGTTAPDPDALAGVNRRIQTRANRANAHTVLLSEENRLGPPIHQELLWGLPRPSFYPEAAACLKYVTFGQPTGGMKFFLFSREPSSFALSLFSEAVRMGQTELDIDAFFEQVDYASIDFQKLASDLRTVDSAITVSMTPFERFRGDAEGLLCHAFEEMGIDTTECHFDVERTRTRLDRSQIDALLKLQRDKEIRPILRQKRRQKILDRSPDDNNAVQLPHWVRDRLE